MSSFFGEIQNTELSTQASFVVYQERSRGMQKEETTFHLGFFCQLQFIVNLQHCFYTSHGANIASFTLNLIYFKQSFALSILMF